MQYTKDKVLRKLKKRKEKIVQGLYPISSCMTSGSAFEMLHFMAGTNILLLIETLQKKTAKNVHIAILC